MSSRWPFLDHPGPLAFAHRGGAVEGRENTLPAFASSVALGYRYLETDAHLTADAVVVAFHDESLDRVTDRSGVIAELPWSEVGQARVGGVDPIVRMDELLATWPEIRFNIDPKHDAVVDPLADVIRAAGAVARVCCGSFSDARLARLRERVGPELCTSMGPRGIARVKAGSQKGRPGSLGAGCVQVPRRIRGVPLTTARFVRVAHANDLQVHVWTVDDPDEMGELLDMGVDGLMTDRPQVLKDVLRRRGQWV